MQSLFWCGNASSRMPFAARTYKELTHTHCQYSPDLIGVGSCIELVFFDFDKKKQFIVKDVSKRFFRTFCRNSSSARS